MTTTTEPAIRTNRLDRRFRPGSIAVVGGSATPGKLGTPMTAAVRRGAGAATISGVNPTTEGIGPGLEAACRDHGCPGCRRDRRPSRHAPEIGELEINPLRLTPDGLIALDAVSTGSDARPANPEDEHR